MQRTALILGLCLISSAAWLGETAFVSCEQAPCAKRIVARSCCCAPAPADRCPCEAAPDPLPVLPLQEEKSQDRGLAWTLPELKPLLEVGSVAAEDDASCSEASEVVRPTPTRHVRRLSLIGVFRN